MVEKHAGTGEVLLTEDNRWKSKEIVVVDKIIGVPVDQKTAKETSANAFTIHYSKTGVHIVPTLIDKED